MRRQPGNLRCSMPGATRRLVRCSTDVQFVRVVLGELHVRRHIGHAERLERREELLGSPPVHMSLGLPHGHHVEPVLVRAGRPGEQSVDVLGRGCAWRRPRKPSIVTPGVAAMWMCAMLSCLSGFVLAGRTLRENLDPAIRGITHRSTHSPSAWVLIDGSRHALRWPRRRSGCGSSPACSRRYMPTQLPRVPSLIPSSFATRAIGRDVSITIFTASSLYSGEKLFFGRGNYFTFPDIQPNGWTVRKPRGTPEPQRVWQELIQAAGSWKCQMTSDGRPPAARAADGR
jgi:hypothetical protein